MWRPNWREPGNLSRSRRHFSSSGKPDLASAVEAVVRGGATRVVVIPYFLTLGLHLERDLPRLIDGIAGAHDGLDIRVTAPLDGHPALVTALLDRANSA